MTSPMAFMIQSASSLPRPATFLLACALSLSCANVQSQPGQIVCTGSGAPEYTAYLILDQSEKSAAFKRAMKEVTRPDLLAVNFVKGDFTKVGPNAERHPLVYVFDTPARPTQVDDPAVFVRMVNLLSTCYGR